eukprot:gnl/Trimastix_PCT/1854.p1 GENE.gnl/Trimastix_PCT/1854~~gnl/Trimastix_PCT/1854.p1  ORF type:complete len:219 (+),score=30.61 gnl/Trimastix_PCT/1854:44-700(+)
MSIRPPVTPSPVSDPPRTSFFDICPDEILSSILASFPHDSFLKHLSNAACVSKKFLRCAKSAPFFIDMNCSFEGIEDPREALQSISGRYSFGGSWAAVGMPVHIFPNGVILYCNSVYSREIQYSLNEEGNIHACWRLTSCSHEHPLRNDEEWKETFYIDPEDGVRKCRGARRAYGSGWCGLIGVQVHPFGDWADRFDKVEQQRMLLKMMPSLQSLLRK